MTTLAHSVADIVGQLGDEHGDRVTEDFLNGVVPRLEDLGEDQLWIMAGMLVYMRNEAEAQLVADYVMDRLK